MSVSAISNRSSVTGSAVTTLTPSATDSSSAATLTWSATGLPDGLSINATTGAITGAPTTAGTYSVTVTATDTASYAGSASFTWTTTNVVTLTSPVNTVSISGLAITPSVIFATDSSSVATFTYSATGLPVGVSVDAASGTLSGTPTTAGVSTVLVTVSDSAGFSSSASFTWTINNVLSLTVPAPPTTVTGAAITPFVPTAADSSSTASIVSWSVTGLAAGLSFSTTTGTVTGTPTTAGNYYGVKFTVTDSAGFTKSTSFLWTVTNTVTVGHIANQTASTNHAATAVAPTATDTQAGVTFYWTVTGTPAGIVIDHTTGTLSGTPTTAGTYTVVLTAGDSATPKFSGTTSFTWTVANVLPAITSITPTTGPGGGGTVVKITGTDLYNTTSVLFGSTPGTSVSANGLGTLVTVTSPAHVVGTVNITLSALGGTSPIITADQFTYTGPTISAITPNSGPSGGGTSVKITGTSLSGATAVRFGTVAATSYTVTTAGTSMTAVAPAGAAGTVDISVVTPGGTSAPATTDQFTYMTPTVTSITPTSGTIAGGTVVKITGTMLTGATAVKFGTSAATAVSVNAAGTIVTATAPAHVAGNTDITVITPSGTTAIIAGDQFTYIAPSVTSIAPTTGTHLGGTAVKITGVNLTGVTAVKFGTTSATTFSVNAAGTIITVTAPAHVAGAVDITVTTPAGTTAVVTADRFTYT